MGGIICLVAADTDRPGEERFDDNSTWSTTRGRESCGRRNQSRVCVICWRRERQRRSDIGYRVSRSMQGRRLEACAAVVDGCPRVQSSLHDERSSLLRKRAWRRRNSNTDSCRSGVECSNQINLGFSRLKCSLRQKEKSNQATSQ